MLSMTQRRAVAVSTFGVVGATLAFLIGAHIGNALDHSLRTMSVAKVPIPAASPHEPTPVVAVAQK